MMHESRGIYVVKENEGKVSGHYLSMSKRGWVVHRFTNCTLAKVVETAEHVIHEPTIYNLKEAK